MINSPLPSPPREGRAPLQRSKSNRMVAGVIGGIAAYIGVDPTLARVIYVVGSIVSIAFPGILIYLILWLVIPPDKST